MIVHKYKRAQRRGKGLVNSIINKLPVILHIAGYEYCGPRTKLKERWARGDAVISPQNAGCKEHDIAYSKRRNNLVARHAADRVLTEHAWKRVLAKDAGLGEKTAAWGVTNTMKAKTKLGISIKKSAKQRKTSKKKKVTLRHIVGAAKASITPGADAIKSALKDARKAVENAGGKSRVRTPRILPIPTKIGDVLPFLIPLLAELSATGALTGGAAGIAEAVNDVNVAKRGLEESKRHDETMESIALNKGLYLKPYREGLGFLFKKRMKLPHWALIDKDLSKFAKAMEIFEVFTWETIRLRADH